MANQCHRVRLVIGSVGREEHSTARCILSLGHEGECAMLDAVRDYHAAREHELGPWQTADEARISANEIRERRGEPRVDYVDHSSRSV